MNMNFTPANEQPLDTLLDGPGFADIFRTIGIVGDSLASGEMEYTNREGIRGYLDMPEHSWGQYMARQLGSTVHLFSKGGMTAEEFCSGFGEACGAYGPKAKPCQCYIIALGVNDGNRSLADRRTPLPMGDVSDVCCPSGFFNNKTVIGYYGRILQKLKAVQPDAKFFLVTIPRHSSEEPVGDAFSRQLYLLAEKFENTYVLDLRQYAPVYDEAFRRKFFLENHMNAAGYSLTAKMMISYIDFIIRHHFEDFSQAALIGTPYKSTQ